jgi:hypothetical protein
MVPGGEDPATVVAEPHHRGGIGFGEAVTAVDGQQPQLVIIELVDVTEYGVVAASIDPVSCDNLVAGGPKHLGQQ